MIAAHPRRVHPKPPSAPLETFGDSPLPTWWRYNIRMVLAGLIFGIPALAWGGLAVSIPVIIHLVLRQRPRRQVLPTMRFLVQAHLASTRTHRLKHFLLLACRMAVIALMVGLLMKTGCAPADAPDVAAGIPAHAPVSVVVAIDNSASMACRFQGRTRTEEALSWARNLLADRQRFPGDSEVAVVSGSTAAAGGPAVNWTRDWRAAGRAIQEVEQAHHDRSVGTLLRQAYALMASASQPRREIYLITDLTESSWRDPPPAPPRELANLFILDVGRPENQNLALAWPELPSGFVPTGQPAACSIRVRSGDSPAQGTVTLHVNDQPRDRQALPMLAANAEATLNFTIPPLPVGIHALTFELQPDDAISFDNRRFAWVAVSQVPPVLVIGDDSPDSVATLMSAMIAPPAQPEAERRFAVQRLSPETLATAALGRSLAVILADVVSLSPGAAQKLSRTVNEGGSLLIVPGPGTAPESMQAVAELLPAPIQSVSGLADPLTLAAADLKHPFLRPFADPGIDSINDRRVYRRLDLGPAASETTVLAPYSDHAPAILERRVGRGRVVLLTFSPHRDWSQFGTQAGPMIILTHAALESLAPRPETVESLTAGRSPLRQLTKDATATYQVQGAGRPLAISPGADGSVRLPAERPGAYRIGASQNPEEALLYYSANVAATESENSRISADAVVSGFPARLAEVVHQPSDLPSRHAGGRGTVSWTVPLALALLALLWIETAFSNAFYGRPKAATSESGAEHPGRPGVARTDG